MRLIKAYVRSGKVEEVVRALDAAKAPGITISRVHGLGYGYEPYLFTLAPSEMKASPEVAKIEVVCADADADRLVTALLGAARTGDPGDGIVFVTAVERAVKIRSGEEGKDALQP